MAGLIGMSRISRAGNMLQMRGKKIPLINLTLVGARLGWQLKSFPGHVCPAVRSRSFEVLTGDFFSNGILFPVWNFVATILMRWRNF